MSLIHFTWSPQIDDICPDQNVPSARSMMREGYFAAGLLLLCSLLNPGTAQTIASIETDASGNIVIKVEPKRCDIACVLRASV